MGVEPGLNPEDHSLRSRHIMDRDEKVGDILRLGAVAVLADIVELTGEGRKHRTKLLDDLLVAAGIDGEIAGLRLRPVPDSVQSSAMDPARASATGV